MAKSTMITVRLEPELKESVDRVLRKLGIPLSVAIEVYLRQIVLRQGIPLELTTNEIKEINKDLMLNNKE